MAEDKSKLKPAGGSRLHFLTTETYEQIRKLFGLAGILPDPAQFDVVEIGGKKQFRYRPPASAAHGGAGGGGGSSLTGDFYRIYEDTGTWYIQGGPVIAGDKNFNVPDYEITGSTEFLLYVDVNVEANRTDDGDYFLPHIKTSADTSQAMQDDPGPDYPANTAPAVADGLGSIVLPVGRVAFVTGDPVFFPTGSGGFRIGQCAGTLSYSRL